MTGTQVSIKDVAERAGVALGTVSNVLNRPEKVAEPTRARVIAAIEQLGFVRNDAARQLKAGKSTSIGFILLDVRNPFFTDVGRGAEQQAARARAERPARQQRRPARAGVRPPRSVRATAGPRPAGLPDRQRLRPTGAAAYARDRHRPRRPCRRWSPLLLGVGGRRRGRLSRRDAPHRAGLPANRLHRRSGDHPAGRRPPARCQQGRRGARRRRSRDPAEGRPDGSTRSGGRRHDRATRRSGVGPTACSAPTTCSPSGRCSRSRC